MVATRRRPATASALHGLLERADVQAQLQAHGVNPAEVKARVAALTDAEAAELVAKIDELPAGGSASSARS